MASCLEALEVMEIFVAVVTIACQKGACKQVLEASHPARLHHSIKLMLQETNIAPTRSTNMRLNTYSSSDEAAKGRASNDEVILRCELNTFLDHETLQF